MPLTMVVVVVTREVGPALVKTPRALACRQSTDSDGLRKLAVVIVVVVVVVVVVDVVVVKLVPSTVNQPTVAVING